MLYGYIGKPYHRRAVKYICNSYSSLLYSNILIFKYINSVHLGFCRIILPVGYSNQYNPHDNDPTQYHVTSSIAAVTFTIAAVSLHHLIHCPFDQTQVTQKVGSLLFCLLQYERCKWPAISYFIYLS